MIELLPALILTICSAGYQCETKSYAMPDWEVCLEAAKSHSSSDVPAEANKMKRMTVVTATCGSNLEHDQ